MRELDWSIFAYWRMFKYIEILDRWELKSNLAKDLRESSLLRLKNKYGLDEPIESLLDKTRIAALKKKYGTDAESTPIPHFRARFKVRQTAGIDASYLDFTEIVRLSGINISSSYAIQSWLRGRGTIELMAMWEQEHNPAFDAAAAEQLHNKSDSQNSTLTLKTWISETKAIGIIALQGRYGGTYATPVIATDFEMWLSPRERLSRIEMFLMKQEDLEK